MLKVKMICIFYNLMDNCTLETYRNSAVDDARLYKLSIQVITYFWGKGNTKQQGQYFSADLEKVKGITNKISFSNMSIRKQNFLF